MKQPDENSTEAFNYLWRSWILLGVYPRKRYNFLQYLHATIVIIFINIILGVTFIVKLFFMEDTKQMFDNLPMNLSVILCTVKYAYILKMHAQLSGISELVKFLDLRVTESEQRKRIQDVVGLCRKMFVMFVICYEGIATVSAIGALLSHQRRLLFEVWVPYDWQGTVLKYGLTFVYQYGGMSLMALQNVTNDISAPMYLVILTAHLEMLMERIANVNRKSMTTTDDENLKELIECIEDHRKIMKIFHILQDTIAYTIFIQFLGTSLVVVMHALEFVMLTPNLVQLALMFFFVSGTILQILPCCYYSNQLMTVSDRLVTAIYSSNWFDQSRKFKRTMIIFMQMTQKSNVIIAGKLVPVTLATFVSIMKMTYSLITLMLNFQKKG